MTPPRAEGRGLGGAAHATPPSALLPRGTAPARFTEPPGAFRLRLGLRQPVLSTAGPAAMLLPGCPNLSAASHSTFTEALWPAWSWCSQAVQVNTRPHPGRRFGSCTPHLGRRWPVPAPGTSRWISPSDPEGDLPARAGRVRERCIPHLSTRRPSPSEAYPAGLGHPDLGPLALDVAHLHRLARKREAQPCRALLHNRVPRRMLGVEEVAECMAEIMAAASEDFPRHPGRVRGRINRVHLLVNFPPKVAVFRLVNSPRDASSRRFPTECPDPRRLCWGAGKLWSGSCFAGSVVEDPPECCAGRSNPGNARPEWRAPLHPRPEVRSAAAPSR